VGMTICGWPKRGAGRAQKKPARFYPDRLVIENGLANFYQNPNLFLNVISTIFSNPVYTIFFKFMDQNYYAIHRIFGL
jgi:hypothetical protein